MEVVYQSYISLDEVINSYISQNELADSTYGRLHNLAVRGRRQLNIYACGKPKTVKLQMLANKTVRLPSDFINDIDVGYISEGGELISFNEYSGISLFESNDIDRIDEDYTGMSTNGYRIDLKHHIIAFDFVVPHSTIYLEYLPMDNEGDGDYMVHPLFQEPLISWIRWQDSLGSKKVSGNDKRDYERIYYRDLGNATDAIRSYEIDVIDFKRAAPSAPLVASTPTPAPIESLPISYGISEEDVNILIQLALNGLTRHTIQIADYIYDLGDLGNEAGDSAYVKELHRGGVFVWYPASAGKIVDNGLVFEGKAGSTWVRQTDNKEISLEWFGTGDGDDAVPLNKAIEVAKAKSVGRGASTINLNGIYNISTPIIVPADTDILFKGQATIKRKAGMIGAMIRIFGTPTDKLNRVSFKDINIDGNSSANSSTWRLNRQNGVYKELNITNVVYGVYAENLLSLSFDNCHFTNIHGTGVHTYRVKTVSVHGHSRFYKIYGRAAIDQNSLEAKLKVKGCDFEDIGVLPNEFYVDNVLSYINDANRYSHQFGDGILDAGLRSHIEGNEFGNCNRISVTRDIANDQGIMNASSKILNNYIWYNSPNIVNSNPPSAIWVEHSKQAHVHGNTIEFIQRGRETHGSVTAIRFNESNQNYADGTITNNTIIANDFVDYAGIPTFVYAGIFCVNNRSYSKVTMAKNHITGRVLDGFYLGNSSVGNIDTQYTLDANTVDIFPNYNNGAYPLPFECSAVKIVASFQAIDGFPKINLINNNLKTNHDNSGVWASQSWKRTISISDNMPVPIDLTINGGNINNGSIYIGNNIGKCKITNMHDIRTLLCTPYTSGGTQLVKNMTGIDISDCTIKELYMPYLKDTMISGNTLISVKINGCNNLNFMDNTINVDKFNAYSVTFDPINSDIYNVGFTGNVFKYIGDGAKFGMELKKSSTFGYKTVNINQNVHVGNGQPGSVGIKAFGSESENLADFVYFNKTNNIYSNILTPELGFDVNVEATFDYTALTHSVNRRDTTGINLQPRFDVVNLRTNSAGVWEVSNQGHYFDNDSLVASVDVTATEITVVLNRNLSEVTRSLGGSFVNDSFIRNGDGYVAEVLYTTSGVNNDDTLIVTIRDLASATFMDVVDPTSILAGREINILNVVGLQIA